MDPAAPVRCNKQTFNGPAAVAHKEPAWPGNAPCILPLGHLGPHDSGPVLAAAVGTRYEDGEGPE